MLIFQSHPILGSLILSFAINMFFFIFAMTFRTDKVTDFTYSLSFVLITVLLLVMNSAFAPGQIILAVLIVIWGLRLGTYLFLRILKIGKDDRFDDKRNNFIRFFGFWILQASTVWIVLIPASIFLSSVKNPFITPLYITGLVIWAIGFLFEFISDAQKYSFKNNPDNRGKWIQSGLWKISRHPNYFGETVLWWGIFIMVISSLSISYLWILVGPIFITLLLLFVSGIPLLEKSAERKYGENEEYREYKRKTSIFIPWFIKK